MDITDNDQYMPEKELNMNFKIPRKRTVEESLGASDNYQGGYSAESSQYANVKPLSAYSGLSGAASRASAHSNYRGPVPYIQTDLSKLDTSVKPPTMLTNQNTSTGATPYVNTSLNKEEYPKDNTSSMDNKWGQDFNQGNNQTGSKFGTTWAGSSNNFSGGNRGQGQNWNSAQTPKWNSAQASKWNSGQAPKWNNAQTSDVKGAQTSDWKGEQASDWKGEQASDWKGAQKSDWKGAQTASDWTGAQTSSDWKGAQTSGWKGAQTSSDWKGAQTTSDWKGAQTSSDWKGAQTSDWKGAQTSNWKGAQTSSWKGAQTSSDWKGAQTSSDWKGAQTSSDWKGAQTSNWKGAQTSNWKDAQTSNWKGAQTSGWKGEQTSDWKGAQTSDWKGAQMSDWKGGQMSNWKGAQTSDWKGDSDWKNAQISDWKGSQASNWNRGMGDRGGSSDDNSLFSRNRDFTDRPRPAEKPFGWNGNGNNGGNSFNRSFRGRGGMKQRGFRNQSNDQENFGRGLSVLDNSDDTMSFGNARGWNSNNDQSDGQRNNRYWNKSEKPKKPKVITPSVVIADTSDESLPKELREMFQPLFCKLCSIQMSSNVMAKMHYVSKNHEKKIRKYLVEHSEKTGEPLHPRATVTAAQGKKEKEEDKDPKHFYCDICDLQLTGKQHAESHYMGKSHNAVRMGRKRPAGQGFYDHTGKWIRKSKEARLELAEGEDNFGLDFRKKPEVVDTPSVPENKPQPVGKSQEQFTCSLCSVSCVSQDQLNIHLSGAKHKKKLKLNGVSPENFTLPEPEDMEQREIEDVTTTVSVDATSSNDTDETLKKKYMTPNGYFYCEKCNLTVNSEIQFKQHLASKNHAKKANASKTE